MNYKIVFSDEAIEEIESLKKVGDRATNKKIYTLLLELEKHPTTGGGQPEQLKHIYSGYWSRRVNKKHRMLYQICNKTCIVEVLSVCGHYGDK